MPKRYSVLALMTMAQVGTALVQQGLGSLGPSVSLALALTKSKFGLLLGMMLLGSAVATALAGIAVDMYGERRVMLWGGLVMGTSLIAAGFIASYDWLLPWITLAGVGYAASTPAGGRAVLLWFQRDCGLAMGVRQMGIPIGGVLGAMLLPAVAALSSYRLSLMLGGTIAVFSTLTAALLYRAPSNEIPKRTSLVVVLRGMREIIGDPRSMLVTTTSAILVCAQVCMLGFFTITLVNNVHLTITHAALALAVAQVGASAGRFVLGIVSDRIFGGDRMFPIMIVSIAMTPLASIVAHLGVDQTGITTLVAFVVGFVFSGWNGLTTTAQIEIGGPDRAGSVLGISLTIVYAVGMIASPLFGMIADTQGLSAAWSFLGIFSLSAVAPASAARFFIAAAKAAKCDEVAYTARGSFRGRL